MPDAGRASSIGSKLGFAAELHLCSRHTATQVLESLMAWFLLFTCMLTGAQILSCRSGSPDTVLCHSAWLPRLQEENNVLCQMYFLVESQENVYRITSFTLHPMLQILLLWRRAGFSALNLYKGQIWQV